MTRTIVLMLLLPASSCFSRAAVPGSALQAAAQTCRGETPTEPHALVFTDRAGRVRIASKVDESGQPAGNSIVIDHKTTARWEDGWRPICHGPDSSSVESISVRRPAPAAGIMIGAAVLATTAVILVPVVYVAACGFHGC